MQIQIQKALSQIDFLSTTVYDRYDLTGLVKTNERLIIRQGDLIISNYFINDRRKKGLRYALLARYKDKNTSIEVFGGNHFIIPLGNKTIITHPEHGTVIIPMSKDKLNFYTFNKASD
jgi:cell wall-associated NlpC family hydrolase